MPQYIQQLLDVLDVEDLGGGDYRGQHPKTQMQRSFGGQVMAQALSAAYRTVEEGRLCHSLMCYFLRPGITDEPIDYTVRQARDGKSFATRRIVAHQRDRECFNMSCSFKLPEDGLEHQTNPSEPVRDPANYPSLASVLGDGSAEAEERWDAEWGALDVRYVSSSKDNPLDPRAHMTLWVRANGPIGDDPRIHQEVLAYLSDLTILAVSTLNHPVNFFAPGMQVATINHAMWFHRQIRADGWVLYDQESPSASNALGFSTGRLYAGGILGASCNQEGLVRQVDPAKTMQPWKSPIGV